MLEEIIFIKINSFFIGWIVDGFVLWNCVFDIIMRLCRVLEIVVIVVNNKIIDYVFEVIYW